MLTSTLEHVDLDKAPEESDFGTLLEDVDLSTLLEDVNRKNPKPKKKKRTAPKDEDCRS